MREMMEEINYWRMVAKHPGAVERPRGGQKTAEMDRVRYQHMAFAEKLMQQQELRVERKFGDL